MAAFGMLAVVACGGRIAGEGVADSTSSDGSVHSAPTNDATPETTVPTVPYGTSCYEGAATSGVSCQPSAGASGSTCTTKLDCEGHIFRANCKDGICQCVNEGYGQCYCQSLGPNACGEGNCCWQ